MDLHIYQEFAKRFRADYLLRSLPIAVKFFERSADVPPEALLPLRDLGKHMAVCQAFSYARMKGATVALRREDHWCWNPLIAFGAVECLPGQPQFDEALKFIGIQDEEKAREFFIRFPRLPLHQYEAVVIAPLESASFFPDAVLIYTDSARLNHMVRGIKRVTGGCIRSVFDGLDSCVYCTVLPMLENEYRITLPDPGERERARTRDDEIILTVPGARLDEFMESQNPDARPGRFSDRLFGFELDFDRPPFYTKLFDLWGLGAPQEEEP